mmetsp:Transcript_4218/g.10310  ORF Transcript_4218/g.10310 Transcript_4218/m.10310 type:complete len:214 (-) Transcript_4218:421-1062(-)
MRQHRWFPSWRHRVVAAPRRQTRGCRAWSTARRPYRGCSRRREPFQDGDWLGQRLLATCGGGSRVSCWVSACRSVQVWSSGASGCRGHRRAVCGRRQRRLGVCRCLSRRRRRSHRRSRRRRERLRCSVVLLQHEPRWRQRGHRAMPAALPSARRVRSVRRRRRGGRRRARARGAQRRAPPARADLGEPSPQTRAPQAGSGAARRCLLRRWWRH